MGKRMGTQAHDHLLIVYQAALAQCLRIDSILLFLNSNVDLPAELYLFYIINLYSALKTNLTCGL